MRGVIVLAVVSTACGRLGFGESSPDAPVHTGDAPIAPLAPGDPVTIGGAGFGTKLAAAPFRTSYLHPDTAMRFQETGAFDPASWSLSGDVMISLAPGAPEARVPDLASNRFEGRMEYSARGNFGNPGYLPYVRAVPPDVRAHYAAWWDYLDPAFDYSHLTTGSYTWIDFGGDPSFYISVDGQTLFAYAAGGVAGATTAEQDANLQVPVGGGFYARPISWYATWQPPRGQWLFVEVLAYVNSGIGVHDGWVELRIGGQRVFRADAVDFFSTSATATNFGDVQLGGYYGFDASGVVYVRSFDDVYIDQSFARVVLCDAPVFSDCRHLENQIPTAWSDTQITFTFARGSFVSGETTYLHVIDEAGQPHGPFVLVIP